MVFQLFAARPRTLAIFPAIVPGRSRVMMSPSGDGLGSPGIDVNGCLFDKDDAQQ